jgi:hypothetical protein
VNAHNPFRIFDNRDNSFYMHEAHLQLERLADKNMIVGYHIELGAGHDPQIYDGSTVSLQEGWVQILAPVGSGLDIRAGKLATLVGYEVLENVNNMNYSRGMLFGIIQPFTHTGVRMAYGMGGSNNDMVTFTLGFNNGLNATDRYSDGDHGKAVEFQVAVKPVKDVLVALTLITGNDTAFAAPSTSGVNLRTSDEFYIFDLVAAYTMDKLTVALNVDFASAQQTTDVAGGFAHARSPLSGFALYGKYAWTDSMASALRFEYFSDKNGALFDAAGTPSGSRTFEVTLTQEIKVANQLILRLEVRSDNCNDALMRRNDKAAKGDNTFGVEAIMPF